MSSKGLISFDTISNDHPCFLDPEEYPGWQEQFGDDRPLVLEIGFGNGNFLLEMAVRFPELNFIGMDFYHKGIRKVITRMDKLHIKNIRVVYGDAKEKLPFLFRDEELQDVYLNFPDPWPKKRHHKRRLVKPLFLKILAEKLVMGGRFRVATDFSPYAEEILELLNEEPALRSMKEGGGLFHDRTDTPKTKYEKTFLAAGKTINYLDFMKVSG